MDLAAWSRNSCCGMTLTDWGMSRSGALLFVAELLLAGE